jgi:hypothetical protein
MESKTQSLAGQRDAQPRATPNPHADHDTTNLRLSRPPIDEEAGQFDVLITAFGV